ncbi:Serine protease, subtilisin family [Micromonospora citrea]|uniref:Serine protease, subtilisin family n=2 Tax=Micromonospora citrea TaxID=47855 RepID=A0A1C6V4B0_9ACTN|nr:Serine protease, subtilisin family [Micromonospora citrea]
MRRLRRTAGGTATAAVVAGLLAAPAPVGAATVDGAPTARVAPRTVTLVTGDRVTLVHDDAYTIQPGAGRAGMAFQTRRVDGRLSVIPADAVALLGAGQLDPRLFDVTTLLRYGYDDRRTDLPLIVTSDRAKGAVPTAGARVDRELPKLNATALRQDRRQGSAFWRGLTGGSKAPRTLAASVRKVWLDGVRQPTLDVSVPQVGAPAAWQAGYTGSGVTVAVLDSGIDDTHPDLAATVTARANFTEGEEDGRDLVGHGTHVASAIAGSGSASGGRYRGVAPGTKLIDGKVCASFGCPESWILAGMQWAAAEQHAKVVNMSLGGWDSPGIDPLEQAVNTLTDRYGTLFVIAAGNDGPGSRTVNSPASADAALAVGAVDKSDKLAGFSSRGPRLGDAGLKPDITAPGVAITAARSRDATDLGAPGDAYVPLSGTSMATPHVAGAAAILAQRHPDWTAGQLKATLMASARPATDTTPFEQGTGRLDVAEALTRTVAATPSSLSFGTQLWPHQDDEVLTRKVAYRNSGATPVTLALTVDRGSAAAGTFAVDPATVTVPAGGDATVTVTVDTRVAGPDGVLTGALIATGEGQGVRVPLAVDREVESYDVTLRHIGRDGAPSGDHQTSFRGLNDGSSREAFGRGSDGTATVRIPAGRYLMDSFFFGQDGDGEAELTLLTQPMLAVTGPKTITLDARLGKASAVTVPRPDATQVHAEIEYTQETSQGLLQGGVAIFGGDFSRLHTAQVGDTAPADGFVSELEGTWAEVGPDGSTANSPYTYSTAHYVEGRMLSGVRRTVSPGDLAAVSTRHLSAEEGTYGYWYATSRRPGQERVSGATGIRYALPAGVTHYYTTEGGVQWRSAIAEHTSADEPMGTLSQPYVHHAPGTHRRTWNQAVFGPALVKPVHGGLNTWFGVVRDGDTISVDLPMHSDAAGNVRFGGDSGGTVLHRNGVKVGESDRGGKGAFTVPAGEAAYRLETRAERGAPYTLSTRIDATWTFRSAHVDGWSALPLWSVRYAPKLDDRHTAPAGQPFGVPVTVAAQPGAQVGRIRTLTVEVSYDDGATWADAKIVNGAALVRHPAGSGFVSLRAAAGDGSGNTVKQTILRAYRYGAAS